MKQICILFLLFFAAQVNYGQNKRKPNIIFIMADDLGYGNIQSFNPKSIIPTPNLNLLSKNGMVFTRFYAGSTVCAPSRCVLMTGFHTGHAYIRGNAKAKDSLSGLRKKDTTLAEVLKRNGYTTGMFGKWALGDNNSAGAAHLKGFDHFYGYTDQTHAHHYYTNYLDEIINGKTVEVPVDTGSYTEDLIINKALSFIKENKNKPFFLYMPLTLPHAELKVPAALMKPFQNADGTSKLLPEKPFAKKGNYSAQAQPHAAFAAMVNKLDSDVGAVVKLIKSLGLENDTYIFFTSDNGAHQEGGGDPDYFNSSGLFRGLKRDLYDGGIHEPLVVYAPGRIKGQTVERSTWAFWDILPTISELTHAKAPQKIDGLSFAPLLQQQRPKNTHQYFYWQFNEGEFKEAILMGDWKLIRFKDKGKAEQLELYNLKTDVGEQKNLVKQYPDRIKTMCQLMKSAKTSPENKAFDWSEVEN